MGTLVAEYARQGWKLCAIPPNTKGPTQSGWNEIQNAIPVGAELPADYGVGLLHAHSGTCAVDIDNLELTKTWFTEKGIDLNDLLNSADAVRIESGTPGRDKLIYRVPMGMPLPSKRVNVQSNGVKVLAFELRCASLTGKSVQDVLPPSRHPRGTHYKWAGRGNWKQLPELPHPLMTIWGELIAEDSIKSTSSPQATPASMDELRSAVMVINPDCDRKTWIDVGMALKIAGEQLDEPEAAAQLFNEWSSKSLLKYDVVDTAKQWRSFRTIPDGIGVGTLFHHANQYGWKKPLPDVDGMFKPITPTKAEDVIKGLTDASPIPEIDLSMFPSVLSNQALSVAEEVGSDPAISIIAGLCAVSAAVDHETTLSLLSSWKVKPIMWCMTIGEPADKKTPASTPMFKPLHELQREDKVRHGLAMTTWEGLEAKHSSQMKAYRSFCESADASLPNAVPPTVETLPPRPEPLRLILTDVTTQRLVMLASYSPRGYLLHLDEMNGWLTRLGNVHGTNDRSTWIYGYEGGPMSSERVSSGTITVDNLAMSIYGNCQPKVFRKNVNDASADGLLQRFLPVVIDAKKNGIWKRGIPEFMKGNAEYDAMIRRTYALPKFDYVLTPEAEKDFDLFGQWLFKFRKLEREVQQHDSYQTALGKIEGNCGRLILLFHIMTEPNCPFVSSETVRRAVTVMQKFFIPMLDHVFLDICGQRDTMGAALFEHILQLATVRETVALGEIRSTLKHRKVIEDEKDYVTDMKIRSRMDELATMGYVAMHQDHPRSPIWAINPAIAEQFKEKRKQIINYRQSRVESLREGIFNTRGVKAKVSDAVGYSQIKGEE